MRRWGHTEKEEEKISADASGRRQRTVGPAQVLVPDMDLDGLRRERATFDLEGLRCSLAKEGMDAADFDALLRLTADGGGEGARVGGDQGVRANGSETERRMGEWTSE